MAALQAVHDEEDLETLAANNGVAADVNNTFKDCVDIVSEYYMYRDCFQLMRWQLKGVQARTGAIGMAVIARVHANASNDPPQIFGSGNALDFLKDGPANFVQDFETWAVKTKKAEMSE